MTIKVTWQSKRRLPVHKRYVRACSDGSFRWCETSIVEGRAWRVWDTRQGTCDAADLPFEIQMKAAGLVGRYPNYVEWPIEGAAG